MIAIPDAGDVPGIDKMSFEDVYKMRSGPLWHTSMNAGPLTPGERKRAGICSPPSAFLKLQCFDRLDLVNIHDELDLLARPHRAANALVPLPDIRDGHIVLLGDPGERFTASYPVQDLLLPH